MRSGVLFVVVGAVLVACTAKEDSGEQSCTIVGTYSLTGEIESGDCPAGSGSGTDSTTVTISAAPPESGVDFALEIQGLTGACPMTQVDACKLQGKCDLRINDPLDPGNAVGSLQFTLNFTNAGFSGFSSLSVPPAKSLPDGCSQNVNNTATRR